MVIMATRQTGAVRAGKMGRGLCAAALCALLAVAARPSSPARGGWYGGVGDAGARRGRVGAARPLRPPLPLGKDFSGIIVDAPAHRVLITTSSRVYVLDEATGRLLGSVPTPKRRTLFVTTPPVVDPRNGDVLLLIGPPGDPDATRPEGVAVLDGRTGRARRIIRIGGSPVNFVADGRRRRLYVFDERTAGARVLDADTFAPLGVWPALNQPMEIDEQAGRIYAPWAKGLAVYDEASRTLLARGVLGGAAGVYYPAPQLGRVFASGAADAPPPDPSPAALGPDYFTIFDARTLRVVYTGNGCASAEAVDTRRARVVCLNITPSTVGPGDLPRQPNDVGFAIVDLRSGAIVHIEDLFSGIQALASAAVDERTGRTIIVTTHDPTGDNSCPCTGIGVYDTRTGRFVGAGPSVVDSGYNTGVVPDAQTGIDYYLDGRNRLIEFRDADATY